MPVAAGYGWNFRIGNPFLNDQSEPALHIAVAEKISPTASVWFS
jgi:hypothetical protein